MRLTHLNRSLAGLAVIAVAGCATAGHTDAGDTAVSGSTAIRGKTRAQDDVAVAGITARSDTAAAGRTSIPGSPISGRTDLSPQTTTTGTTRPRGSIAIVRDANGDSVVVTTDD